jgi:hypothetical protein
MPDHVCGHVGIHHPPSAGFIAVLEQPSQIADPFSTFFARLRGYAPASTVIGFEQYTHSPNSRLNEVWVVGSPCSHSARHTRWKGLEHPSQAMSGTALSNSYS